MKDRFSTTIPKVMGKKSFSRIECSEFVAGTGRANGTGAKVHSRRIPKWLPGTILRPGVAREGGWTSTWGTGDTIVVTRDSSAATSLVIEAIIHAIRWEIPERRACQVAAGGLGANRQDQMGKDR